MAKIQLHTGRIQDATDTKVWSKLQQTIFDAVSSTNNNILIQARAGSGKTTTLVECARRLPVGKRVLFMAFNKSIVEELGNKLPLYIDCRTLHALAFEYCKRGMDKFCAVSNWKISNILQAHIDMENAEEKGLYYSYRKTFAQIVGIFKANNMHTPISTHTFKQYWEGYEDEQPSTFTINLYRVCEEEFFTPRVNGKRYEIDFDDMLYLAVNCGYVKPAYDVIFIDEAQDISAIQREFIKQLLVPGGRVIVAGDEYQAIYGFRGASYKSLDFFKAAYHCDELPLSISYRCPATVIKEANRFVTDIQHAHGVGTVGVLPASDVGTAKPGDMVLSRYNKPLIAACISLLKQGIPAYVLGSDIQEHLLKHAKKVKQLCRGKLGEKELELYFEVHSPSMSNDWKRMFLRDVTDTLILITRNKYCILNGLEAALETMFQTKDGAVICSTVHKAKGMEADNVFFLEPEGVPCKFATGGDELQQEYNLIYVAITRAKKALYYVTNEKGWSWRNENN